MITVLKHFTLQQHSTCQLLQIFVIIVLRNITGEDNNIYHSTVTADHVPITYNGTTIRCSDNIYSSEKTIAIGILSCLILHNLLVIYL